MIIILLENHNNFLKFKIEFESCILKLLKEILLC